MLHKLTDNSLSKENGCNTNRICRTKPYMNHEIRRQFIKKNSVKPQHAQCEDRVTCTIHILKLLDYMEEIDTVCPAQVGSIQRIALRIRWNIWSKAGCPCCWYSLIWGMRQGMPGDDWNCCR